ncbi:MAG TPA: hypothetical protein VFJ07_21960 [Streptosporangiaceae bacterium]|nr:hypothetical protein [Streptosporangiaceae bacterium]
MGDASWARLLGADPVPGLLACGEPAAVWVARTAVLNQKAGDPHVVAARATVLADPGTAALIGRLPDWTAPGKLSGHHDPRFAPHLLNLLADMGVTETDHPKIGRLLDQFLAHQDTGGRFLSFGAARAGQGPVWGSLPCDTHAVTEVLVRYGRAGDPRVVRALARIADDLTTTAQGRAWLCRPHTVTGFRGPGRKGDFCPQVTLQALRAFAGLPASARPGGLTGTARVALRAWRIRGAEKPYMFGHGMAFKTVKWPVTWYGAYAVLDTLGRYPKLWRGQGSDPADRAALAELAACLVAYNAGPDGWVVPRSVYRGFETFSFGQKKRSSPFATARLLAVLHRVDDLAGHAGAIDVAALASSMGGQGRAVPPPAGLRRPAAG